MNDLVNTLKARADAWQATLRDEGFAAKEPVWDAEARTWDIVVKYEGAPVIAILDVDDPEFVRLMLPNFWEVKAEHLGAALIAADMANKKCKVAKIFLNAARDQTIATAEFLDDGAGAPDSGLLVRYIRMVINAAKVYVGQLREAVQAS